MPEFIHPAVPWLPLEPADYVQVTEAQNSMEPDEFAAWVAADLPERIRQNDTYATRREMEAGRLGSAIRQINEGIRELEEHRATVQAELDRIEALPSLLDNIKARRAAQAAPPPPPEAKPQPMRIPTRAERRKGITEPDQPGWQPAMPVVISEGADPATSDKAPTLNGA